MTSRISSGSSRVESVVEPTRSTNMTVSWRRSAWDGAVGPRQGAASSLIPTGGGGGPARASDRLEHDLARPQRQPELAQVGVGQLGQGPGRDLGVLKRRRVALQPQVAQPSRDVDFLSRHERHPLPHSLPQIPSHRAMQRRTVSAR